MARFCLAHFSFMGKSTPKGCYCVHRFCLAHFSFMCKRNRKAATMRTVKLVQRMSVSSMAGGASWQANTHHSRSADATTSSRHLTPTSMTTMSLVMSAITALEVPAAVTAYGSAEHEWSNQVTGGFRGISWHQISGELLPAAMECIQVLCFGQTSSAIAQDCVSEPPEHRIAESLQVHAWQHATILAE